MLSTPSVAVGHSHFPRIPASKAPERKISETLHPNPYTPAAEICRLRVYVFLNPARCNVKPGSFPIPSLPKALLHIRPVAGKTFQTDRVICGFGVLLLSVICCESLAFPRLLNYKP